MTTTGIAEVLSLAPLLITYITYFPMRFNIQVGGLQEQMKYKQGY